EERDRLPPPRGEHVKVCRGGEEPVDLLGAEQVRVGGNEPGFPPVGQHVGVGASVGPQPPAEVADVGHPGPVPAGPGQLFAHPSLDGVAVEHGPAMAGAVGVELTQIPDPGSAVAAHRLLDRQVGLERRREHADEPLRGHGRAPAGTGSTHSSRRAWSTLRYTLVDSELAWPSTVEIVGSGTAARSSREAALCRSRLVPTFTSVTPAARNVVAVTR